jgi:hypothetical protein
VDPAAQELINRHNEQVRELIVRDIDALEQRLNVKRQVSRKADEAMDKVKGTLGMNHSSQDESMGGFVRSNAVPLLAVGIGGALLARNLRERTAATDSQSTTTRMVSDASYEPSAVSDTSTVQDAKAKVADAADTAKAKVSDVADAASTKAGEVTDTARAKVDDAKTAVADSASAVSTHAVHAKDVVVEHVPSREEASRMAAEHYQMLGLAALGAGALIGTFAPRTKLEERTLAPVQEQVKERAGELVGEGVEKAKETADRATEALSAAADTAKEEFADSGDDEPPSGGEGSSELPDLTRPNRITSSRSSAPSGNGSGTGTTRY